VEDLGPAVWPPEPIRTERLVLREPEARDRAAFIELLASPGVGAYLGGPRPWDELEREMPDVPGRHPGHFVVDLDGAMIGQVQLGRATDHGAGRAELGYLFLPRAWGFGYAAEACAAALGWLDDALPGEVVVLKTQTANTRSMRLAVRLGFTEVERFQAWGAEQWFGMRQPVPDIGTENHDVGSRRSWALTPRGGGSRRLPPRARLCGGCKPSMES
jgi:RimJ/RimL family protein N-acetyltransferase